MAEKRTSYSNTMGYDAMSFGRYLKALRLERGISINSVAAQTRINLRTLELIEAEDHNGLPDRVFVQGFLRSYAKIVGANPDETVQRYLANCHLRLQRARYEADLIRSGQRFWPRLIISLGALACLIFVSVVLTSQPESMKKPAKRNQTVPIIHSKIIDPVRNPPAPEKTIVVPQTDPLSLAISAVQDTWIKIIIDEQTPKQYTLNPGDRLELTANKGFNLLIGNAAGVKLMFNNKPYPVSGKQDQTVTLQLH